MLIKFDLNYRKLFLDSFLFVSNKRKVQAENFIKLAAKIISPVIESNFSIGYDWCIDQVKMSSYHEIAHDLEIDKAVMFLKQKDFHQVRFRSKYVLKMMFIHRFLLS